MLKSQNSKNLRNLMQTSFRKKPRMLRIKRPSWISSKLTSRTSWIYSKLRNTREMTLKIMDSLPTKTTPRSPWLPVQALMRKKTSISKSALLISL
jgi:hypothetical protein